MTRPVPIPADEPARLAALQELAILDTPSEPDYDDVVRLAAAICGTPIAIINLVDADRQWGKALVGLESSEAPREASFCARTIVTADGRMVVEDTHADPAWSANPMVTADPHLRFYAGSAIRTGSGHAVGSVCVADRVPRHLDEVQLAGLDALARQTAMLFDLRRKTASLAAANARLHHLAVHDPLTGLPNRMLLAERLEQELARSRRSGRRLGLLFCDLDGFKRLNDEHGHHVGDEALRIVAGRLRESARAGDTVARIAGDEFAVLCPEVESRAALGLLADRLCAAVARPAAAAGVAIRPRMSAGAALATPADDAASLLGRADAAMYAAKRAAA